MARQKGFTILEALVALLLIAIALIGAVTATINGAAYVKATTHRIIAQGITQGEIGKLRVYGYSNVLPWVGQSTVTVVIDEGDPAKPDDSLSGQMVRTIQALDMDNNGSTDILKLDISLQWQEFGRQYEQKSVSLLTKRSF